MAMIENIRKRRGLLIFLIGLGMVMFLVPFDAVMSLFGRNAANQSVGEFDGESVNVVEWQNEQKLVAASNLYQGESNIQSAAWRDLVDKKLYGADLQAAGYAVGETEYDNVRYGISPSEMVKTAYYGGTVTEESRERARELFEMQPPAAESAQRALILKRYKLQKLESLLKKGFYANALDAERDYLMKNDKVKVDFVGVKYKDLADSLVTVSDNDVKSYFNQNKTSPKYKQNPFREVQLITFNIEPSSADSIDLMNALEINKTDFMSSEDDSLFVVDRSEDGIFVKETYVAETLEEGIDSVLVNAPVGTVVGPYEDDGKFKLSKVIDKKPVVSRANARHIFLSAGFQKAEQDSVQNIADSLKKILNDGGSWSTQAAKWSQDDSTSNKGGILGWMDADAEINPEEKVKNTLRTRLMAAEKGKAAIAKVPGGISIYEAVNFEYDGENSVLAVLSNTIEASEATKDEIYEKASELTFNYSTTDDLVAAAEADGIKATSQKVRNTSRTISSIPNSEAVVFWTNNRERDLGEVSDVFNLPGQYVIAGISKIQDGKVPDFSTVEEDVRADVLKKAKFDYLKSDMESGDLASIEGKLEGAIKRSATLTFNSTNIAGFGGNEPEAVGLAFGAPDGSISRPVQGTDGALVIQVNSKELAGEKASYADTQSTLQGTYSGKYSRIRSSLSSQLVKDNRNR